MSLIRPVERDDAQALLELRLANRDFFQRRCAVTALALPGFLRYDAKRDAVEPAT